MQFIKCARMCVFGVLKIFVNYVEKKWLYKVNDEASGDANNINIQIFNK